MSCYVKSGLKTLWSELHSGNESETINNIKQGTIQISIATALASLLSEHGVTTSAGDVTAVENLDSQVYGYSTIKFDEDHRLIIYGAGDYSRDTDPRYVRICFTNTVDRLLNSVIEHSAKTTSIDCYYGTCVGDVINNLKYLYPNDVYDVDALRYKFIRNGDEWILEFGVTNAANVENGVENFGDEYVRHIIGQVMIDGQLTFVFRLNSEANGGLMMTGEEWLNEDYSIYDTETVEYFMSYLFKRTVDSYDDSNEGIKNKIADPYQENAALLPIITCIHSERPREYEDNAWDIVTKFNISHDIPNLVAFAGLSGATGDTIRMFNIDYRNYYYCFMPDCNIAFKLSLDVEITKNSWETYI